MKVGTAHSSSQNSHLKGLCHCATSAGTHLFKYCKKLRPLFQERKRNKMGFFNPSFHLVSNKPSRKGRSTDIPGLGSQSILLLQRSHTPCSHKPGLSHLALRAFQRWSSMFSVMTAAAAPNSSRVSAKCPSLESSYVVTPR